MVKSDEIRLILKVCNYYYKKNLYQSQIAKKLDLSQSAVSRLLKEAEKKQIVKFTIAKIPEYYTDIEDQLAEKYGLKETIVIKEQKSEGELVSNLGQATSHYLQNTINTKDVIGISCWSKSLFQALESMHYFDKTFKNKVVQVLGGLGSLYAKQTAFKMVEEFSNLLNGTPVLMPAPGIVENSIIRTSLMKDLFIKEAFNQFDKISLCITGIGALNKTRLMKKSGNTFLKHDEQELKSLKAVGHICLRFFDKNGKLVNSNLNKRVMGIQLDTLKKIKRRVAVAGGQNKHLSIKAALIGGFVNVLITDLDTAKYLLNN